MILARCLFCATLVLTASSQQLKGNSGAVYDLLDRVLPGASGHFAFDIVDSCPNQKMFGRQCYEISDEWDGRVKIQGTSASELSAGVGAYLREYCNMTFGWPRGGNNNIYLPKDWPPVGKPVTKARLQPWSYFMNVCTHSYSFVWYSWEEWESLIDWMALSGINLVLAMTGQEEIQYKVLRKFGLNDTQLRSWFNGPAFLTWSRGQNEYGSGIAGPLPRSWMQNQWSLQRKILSRYRTLGIVGQLPGFQGNVPIGLKFIQKDANMTDNQKGTAWIDSLDPLFGKIADEWMRVLIEDFGTDHWYQLDGYFNGGTAPWMEPTPTFDEPVASTSAKLSASSCAFSNEQKGENISGCSLGCKRFKTLALAQAACSAELSCGGVTSPGGMMYELRASLSLKAGIANESSWLITNAGTADCHPPDPMWIKRGSAAYGGLNRTDPDAIWSFQGWAVNGWNLAKQANQFQGFIKVPPPGKFVVIDMATDAEGQWRQWGNASFWGAPFIWTTLHNFGGNDAMRGNLARVNEMPFAAMPGEHNTSVWGTGFTPEGIDQNPVYYEFAIGANWREARVPNITEHVILRSHRRYGLAEYNEYIAQAWALLVNSTYSQDLGKYERHDGTGVPRFPGKASQFEADRFSPSTRLCQTFAAWKKMMTAAMTKVPIQSRLNSSLVTVRYDLINLGRELLAQIATPASMNFTDAIAAEALSSARIHSTGSMYIEVLRDLDKLVAADSAFLLGPWIEQARRWGTNSSDCSGNAVGIRSCEDFYEWNARVQITSWIPTLKGDEKVPSGPKDYASKHWSGLINDYDAERVHIVMQRALLDAAASRPIDHEAVENLKAQHAYNWTTSTNKYPVVVQGDALEISRTMLDKYSIWFASCPAEFVGVEDSVV